MELFSASPDPSAPAAIVSTNEGAQTGSRSLPHVAGFDGLRGIAVIMVTFTHLMLVFAAKRLTTILAGGFFGVELFFVLSGFLITTLLINERDQRGSISLRGFYTRRALRLLPALFAMLAVHFVYAALTGADLRVELRSVLVATFYVTNWWTARGNAVSLGLAHLWSLAVEEQFYLLWPLATAAMLAGRRTRKYAILIIVVGMALLTVRTSRQWHRGTNFLNIDSIYARTDTQAVELLAGAAAAYAWQRYRIPRLVTSVAAGISTCFIAFCAWELFFTDSVLYKQGVLTLFAVAAAIVVYAIADGNWTFGRLLSWRPLCALGRVSYGLYLWHLPIFFAVYIHCASLPTALQIVIALAITAAFTGASWRFVETPFLRRKARMMVIEPS